MKNNIVEVIDNDLFIGTHNLSKLFNVEHRSLKQTIKNNINDVLEFGDKDLKSRSTLNILNVESRNKNKKKIGRPIIEYLLNEQQATFVVLLLKGHYKTDKVSLITKFKKHVTNQFFKQRKLLSKIIAQRQNAEWLEKRESGKIERRVETDVIKEFVEYALSQGSKSASKYYMIISKMENHTLFNLDMLELKYPNLRDVLEGYQLSTLQNADRIVARALKEGMEQQLFYKEIYQSAKERVERFVQLIGKTPIQLLKTETKALA